MEGYINISYLSALISSWIVAGWIHMVKADCDSSYDPVPLHHTLFYKCFTAFPILLILISLIINIFKVSFVSTCCYALILVMVQLLNRNILYYIYRSLFGNDRIGTVIPLLLIVFLLVYLFIVQDSYTGYPAFPLYLGVASVIGAFLVRIITINSKKIMGLLDLFKAKPKTPKEMLLYKLRQAFDDCARNAKAQKVDDSLLKSSLIYAALVDLYNTLKSSQEMQALYTIQELNFSESLDAELERALHKHLNKDFNDILAFKKFEESISVLTKTLKNNIPFVDVIIKHPKKKDEYYYAYKKDNPSENPVIKISKLKDSIIITSPSICSGVYPQDANQREIAIKFEEEFWLSMIDIDSPYFADPILIAPQLRKTMDTKDTKDIIDMLKTRTYFSKSFYDKLSEIESRMIANKTLYS